MNEKIKVSNAARPNVKTINNMVLDFTAMLRDVSTDMYDICLRAGFPDNANAVFLATDGMCSEAEGLLSENQLNINIPDMMKLVPMTFLRILAEMMSQIGPEIENYFGKNDNIKSEIPNLSLIKNQKSSYQQNETSNTEESGEGEVYKQYFQEIEFIRKTFDYLFYQYIRFLTVDEQITVRKEFDDSFKREIFNNITNMDRVNLSVEILFTGLNVLVNSINQIRMFIRGKQIDSKMINDWKWGGIQS